MTACIVYEPLTWLQIIREEGKPVAVIQWEACAYHLKDREAWIGWNALTCAQRRNLVVNNGRFLVLESAAQIPVPQAA